MQQNLTTLYRPVGEAELDLIRASGYREFPPRLPAQPYFYPVTNEEYAIQIARDWNTKDAASGYLGYVLRFSVQTEFLSRYEIHTVGDSHHREYWIPAADLPSFNENIAGISRFYQSFARLTRPRFELLLGMGTEECQIRGIVRGQVFVSGTNFPDELHYAAGRARGCVLVVEHLDPHQNLTEREHR